MNTSFVSDVPCGMTRLSWRPAVSQAKILLQGSGKWVLYGLKLVHGQWGKALRMGSGGLTNCSQYAMEPGRGLARRCAGLMLQARLWMVALQ